MGGGGSSAPTYSSQSTSTPVLYNWQNILPPWVQAGQQTTLPWLMNRAASGGLTQQQQSQLWGGIQDQLQTSFNAAGQNMSRQISSAGIDPSSPAAAGAFSQLASDKLSTTSQAALNFAKMKLGEQDTAIGQMLTALYTPPPVAVGTQSTSYSSQTGGGGGK
jgi:hypothetical protein